jgi:hypothetical protein
VPRMLPFANIVARQSRHLSATQFVQSSIVKHGTAAEFCRRLETLDSLLNREHAKSHTQLVAIPPANRSRTNNKPRRG